jgi:gamma-glutamyltranspeptidase/glutathione hydrolase
MNHTWDLPYPSRRAPVMAANIVATSQPLAVQAGLQMLQRGGNAVDAAIATAITLTVVEPNNNGIGSDAFALVWDGRNLHGLNASGRSPAAWSPERFSDRSEMPVAGWDAVTVPGAVSGWVALSDKFGNLPFSDLFEPATRYARDGFQLGPISAPFWERAALTYSKFESFMNTFTLDGIAPATGELTRLPDHARSLAKIAETRGEAFYRGELAAAMIRDSDDHQGLMTLEDLASHSADWVTPISQAYHQRSLHEIPPNGQGLLALIALGILQEFDLKQYPVDSTDSVHLQVEAVRQAYAIIERQLADPDYMQKPAEYFLGSEFLHQKAADIRLNKASNILTRVPANPDTVYLTTADSNGMMVSMIQSNYLGFGSGIVVPGTGISLQNRGKGFTLEDGHPNQVAGSKRPYHTIIPGFVTQGNMPLMSFGVMGGHMQAQGHVQMMARIFDYQQNPQAASDAPRWHVMQDGQLALEHGFDTRVAADLAAKGHKITFDEPSYIFGGAQLITKLDNGYCGASDHRKEGMAAGF